MFVARVAHLRKKVVVFLSPETAMPVHPDRVVVHPTVLLSVVDHFNRMAKVGSQKRVVGILLGSWRKGLLDVSNCFAGEKLGFFLSFR